MDARCGVFADDMIRGGSTHVYKKYHVPHQLCLGFHVEQAKFTKIHAEEVGVLLVCGYSTRLPGHLAFGYGAAYHVSTSTSPNTMDFNFPAPCWLSRTYCSLSRF